jgi:hypothetical protein
MIAEIISSVSSTGLRGGEGSVLLRCFGPSMSKSGVFGVWDLSLRAVGDGVFLNRKSSDERSRGLFVRIQGRRKSQSWLRLALTCTVVALKDVHVRPRDQTRRHACGGVHVAELRDSYR